jgi:hypothetical protein
MAKHFPLRARERAGLTSELFLPVSGRGLC